ncbi:MAG: heat-inducible transcription repressor HrcA [Firmicutes bacterium HGW-Firmicutes-2]|jgi:heat-inducible transcriptional repressor|nr:MAG: heat-inducible transcription repressor HrcA [Firmicutes bacterium HGW-Firmicutes-2]
MSANNVRGDDSMELNERKLKILEAIISNYLDTAEPVGSRTISKNYDLGISPATIRNEMSDLEELGFIMQPHTSAGRIPSDKGYRLYVDMILSAKYDSPKHLSYVEALLSKAGRIETLLQDIVAVLAKETNLTAIVSTPQYSKCKIKNIQLIELESQKVLAVIVTDGNMANNYVLEINEDMDQPMLNKLSFILNNQLHGLDVEEINLPLIEKIKAFAGNQDEIIGKVLEVVFQAVHNNEDTQIYTSGAINMLRLPEFSDLEKATSIMETLDKKDYIRQLLLNDFDGESIVTDGVNIKIGSENNNENMKDCSLITTTYHIGGKPLGVIGLIGPKRMDYQSAIFSLKCLIKEIEKRMNDS